MTRSTGAGRGGKRPGAGRKRDPVYEAQLLAVKLGDRRLMERADELRAAAEAGEKFSN